MANVSSTSADIVICSDAQALALDAAHRFTALAAARSRAGQPFTVALAGGNTPALLYRLLAAPPFVGAIDWNSTHLFFGDDRCVPTDSQFSNYRMAHGTLIGPIGLPDANVHRIHGEEANIEAAARAYEAEIMSFFASESQPRFDLVLLGMGSDGHCASLFPGTRALAETSRAVIVSEPGLEPFVPRITLTFPALNNAANVLFTVAGPDKADSATRVLTGPPAPETLPAQSVRPTDGTLTWLLDRAAAGLP
jgi:6-phosphogluconolactonase